MPQLSKKDVGAFVIRKDGDIPALLIHADSREIRIMFLDGSGNYSRPNEGFRLAVQDEIIEELESYAKELRDVERD